MVFSLYLDGVFPIYFRKIYKMLNINGPKTVLDCIHINSNVYNFMWQLIYGYMSSFIKNLKWL